VRAVLHAMQCRLALEGNGSMLGALKPSIEYADLHHSSSLHSLLPVQAFESLCLI
jgi:hypothetical protein